MPTSSFDSVRDSVHRTVNSNLHHSPRLWHWRRSSSMPFIYLFAFLYPLLQACLLSVVSCLSDSDIENLLYIHNYYRRLVATESHPQKVSNMNELRWSNELAALAAQNLTCQSRHEGQVETLRSNVQYGVNVGRRRQMPNALRQIVRRWYRQSQLFLPEEDACLPWNGCNEYRNMVNAKHREIGCATVEPCGGRNQLIVLLCLYDGGPTDHFNFKHGLPCTACSHPMSFCNSNLCVSCDASRNECQCTKTCVKEGVGFGTLDPSTCTCNCQYGNGPNCDELCQNPVQFLDYDICAQVPESDCNDPEMGPSYREFCPELCSCRPAPSRG
ncbi:cysteine-rich venom protein ENH1 [Aplysia californica]|uniref:Cysteine-rich venom protein ENH1 n=1 Tax=Aplysia californica TaxID=6500 RepID=A0ABM1VPR2_APLCA|nr:cysteine-rich venom protein ENH1 [Aplysia californica]XP_035824404.1 cysteine-rich venom protein ENH1 [Aplysia californica]